MIVTKCDSCHEENQLYFFKNIVDSGFSALCWDCAVKCGKFSGTSKMQMIDDEINMNMKERADLHLERCMLLDMYIQG